MEDTVYSLGTMNIIIAVLLLVSIVVIAKSAIIVPQGFHYTIERFGKYVLTLKPGLHLILPFIYRIGARVNMMENVLDVPSQDIITKDNAVVTVDGIVFFQILDAAKSSYEVTNLQRAILNLTITNVRTVMGSMDLDELLSMRETINARLLLVVDEATSPWGTKVTRVEIKDIKPPKDLVDSMARQMKAEREKRAVILEAEGERQSAILQAEGKKQSQILRAEGVKTAMILEADARKEAASRDAQARERLAEAEAKATTLVSNALDGGTPHALNYFVAQNYVKAFSELASSSNEKVIFMPMEVSSVISSIGGISKLVQETMKPNQEEKS